VVNFVVQGILVYVIFQQFLVFDPLGGSMNLCSFGADFSKCPGGPNCIGPGGTNYTKSNLMADFGDWQTRMLVRDQLVHLFPEKEADIRAKVVPGEYGLESPIGRYVCIIIFVLAISADLQQITDSMSTIWHLPTEEGCWMYYDKDEGEKGVILGTGLVDWVKFRVAGIPLRWKIFYISTVHFPKLVLWVALLIAGCTFLFQTADIVDLVLNSLALGFILEIDELILSRLSTNASHHVMANIEGWKDPHMEGMMQDLEDEHDDESIERHEDDYVETFWDYFQIFPKRLVVCFCAICVAYAVYFFEYCKTTADGSSISIDTHPPVNIFFNPLNIIFNTVNRQEAAVWTMPSSGSHVHTHIHPE